MFTLNGAYGFFDEFSYDAENPIIFPKNPPQYDKSLYHADVEKKANLLIY